MAGAVDIDPILNRRLQTADPVANLIVQNLGSASGQGIESRVAQAGECISEAQAADFRDIDDLRSRKTVAPDIESLFDRAQQVFIPFDLQFRMKPPCIRMPVPPRSMVS